MSLPPSSRDFYRSQQRLAVLTVAASRRAWSGMGADFDRSWVQVAPKLVVLAAAAQMAAARAGAAYVPAVLAETNQPDDSMGEVNPRAFAGTAADGRSLDGLLVGAVVEAKVASGQGLSSDQALARGGRWLDMATQTLVADAGRQATGVGIAARPAITGYVRMLNPPSCSLCAILAGKYFKWNAGFKRHPRCFPSGVVVSGPAVNAATRRWYDGELVVLTTASGQELPVTGNHPVLTRRGWVPANLLQEGDEVVRSTRPQGAAALVIPDHDEVPACIEDVWAALSVTGLDSVESSPKDFHGDGRNGQVDVVRADGSLDDRVFIALDEQLSEEHLPAASWPTVRLPSQGLPQAFDLRDATEAGGTIGAAGLGLALVVGELPIPNFARLAHAPTFYSGIGEDTRDRAARDAVLTGQAVLTGPIEIRLDDLLGRQDHSLPRWDAPGDSFTMETADGYTSRGRDLLHRLSGQVEVDRVVKVRRAQWSGHVFSLASSEGWHTANSLIVSNCDCTHIPASEDVAGDFRTNPEAAARAGQITDLRPADVRALAEGADLSQLVNARRGSSGMTTTQGATRRGLAGKRLGAEKGKRAQRLTPEGVYAKAGDDRDEAIRLLRQHGYVI